MFDNNNYGRIISVQSAKLQIIYVKRRKFGTIKVVSMHVYMQFEFTLQLVNYQFINNVLPNKLTYCTYLLSFQFLDQ